MADKKYKIKLEGGRVLGPLDLARVTELIRKGRLTGAEPTAKEPFTDWRALSSFSELSDLLLKKLDAERARAGSGKDGIEREAPTLVNVVHAANADTEKTRILKPGEMLPAVAQKGSLTTQSSGDSTQLIPIAELTKALEEVRKEGKKEPTDDWDEESDPYAESAGAGPKKKHLMSKRTAILLALGIMLVSYYSLQEEEAKTPSSRLEQLTPQAFKFPFVDVNSPPQIGNKPNPAASNDLTEGAIPVMRRDTPLSYIKAIKEFLYPAISKNNGNWRARALLATAYMRVVEVVARDQQYFESLTKLLTPEPPKGTWLPEYVAARAEFYMLLQRQEAAKSLLDDFAKKTAHPDVLAALAELHSQRQEYDQALSMITRALANADTKDPPPRLLRLYAEILEKKNQREPAKQAYEKILKKHPHYGPAIVALARQKFQASDHKGAIKTLLPALERPESFDRIDLGEAFLLAAKVFESAKLSEKALEFAEAARNLLTDKEEVEDFILRIKAKDPDYQKSYAYIVAARQKEKAREYDAAINTYIRAIEANSKDYTPVLLMGRLYERIGKFEEAINRYQRATNFNRPPIDAFFELAELYIRRFDVEKAGDMIKRADDFKKQRDMVDYLRALLKHRQGQTELAEALYRKILTAGSRLPSLYVKMAEIESSRNNWDIAEFYYAIALRYEPFHNDALLGLALVRFNIDSPSGAIEFLKYKLAQQPNSAAIMANLGVIYQRSNDFDSAKLYFSNAIRTDQQYVRAAKLLGDILRKEGNSLLLTNLPLAQQRIKEALSMYELYIKFIPTDPDVYLATADLYMELSDLGAAAKNYHKVLALAPTYPSVRLKLAKISANGQDLAKALQLVNEELKLNPDNANAYVVMGRIHFDKAEYVQAQSQFVKATRLDPKNVEAVTGLAIALDRQGNFEGAAGVYEQGVRLAPLNPQIHYNLAIVYAKIGNRGKAVAAMANYKGLIRDPALQAKADAWILQNR